VPVTRPEASRSVPVKVPDGLMLPEVLPASLWRSTVCTTRPEASLTVKDPVPGYPIGSAMEFCPNCHSLRIFCFLNSRYHNQRGQQDAQNTEFLFHLI